MDSEGDRKRRVRCVTLTDVVHERLALRVDCKTCGHARVVEAEPLWRLARVRRWTEVLVDLGRHLRCSACRAKWPSVEPTAQLPDGPTPIGPGSAIDAKRAANRLRC